MKIQQYLFVLQEKVNLQIYCDMDGVLVDFEKRAFQIDKNWKENGESFWKRAMKIGISFYSEMQWLPDGKKLWDAIKDYHPVILSAYPLSMREETIAGKKLWLKKEINVQVANEAIFVRKKEKKNYATTNSLLIDDDLKNISEFKAEGGLVIHHKNAKTTIQQLRRYL